MTQSSAQPFDLFVIGGGSGGVRAARVAAGLGARVGLCEESALGGTCVNLGCVPKKLLYYGAAFSESFSQAAAYGWSVQAEGHDWPALIAAKDAEITRLNGIYRKLLVDSGVSIFEGRGAVAGANQVEVGGRVLEANNILIATGGWPFTPLIPGRELCMTSNEVFGLPARPKRIIIVGGGYIGVEFASIFRGFGSEVTLVHREAELLRGFDQDVRLALAEGLLSHGVHLKLTHNLKRIDLLPDGETRRVTLADSSTLDADAVLLATGRVPRTRGLGLEDAGVALDARGAIITTTGFQSSVPSIYALGDVSNRYNLTPVALSEGSVFARRLFANATDTFDPSLIPTAVFSHPQIACVGLTEGQAREQYPNISVFVSKFRPLKNTLTGQPDRTLMKLVVDKSTDRVLGCHMVGADAAEIIQGFAVALRCGATKHQFDTTLGIHPTAAEEFVTMRQPTR